MKTTRTSHLSCMALTLAAIIFSLAVSAQAQTEKILYFFPSPGTNGANLAAPLTLGAGGSLFGTGAGGSTARGCPTSGCGVVFELVRGTGGTWTEKVLHTFAGHADGSTPESSLIFDASGNLYGTAEYAGNTTVCTGGNEPGCGVVFKLSRSGAGWTETVLYTFTGGTDGGNPVGGLVFDSAGNLYGTTTTAGNVSACGGVGCGTVFELSPSGSSWTETTLHTFVDNGTDGVVPTGPVTLDASGNVYGVTLYGGNPGFGTVFQLAASSGWAETILHNFTGGTDGWNPNGGLILDAAGNVYGSTVLGGNPAFCGSDGCGVVFKLSATSSWSETVLTTAAPFDGEFIVGLTADTSGNFYFVGSSGGNNPSCSTDEGCGAVTKLSPSTGGHYTASVLHRFAGFPDGTEPQAGVTVDAAGNLFGSAPGGEAGYGIIYEIRQ
jgi:uncharacterized repeat protein (TIGR03803 family)